MPMLIRVSEHEIESADEAAASAAYALDDVISWFVEDGYTEADIHERVDESIERAQEDG